MELSVQIQRKRKTRIKERDEKMIMNRKMMINSKVEEDRRKEEECKARRKMKKDEEREERKIRGKDSYYTLIEC